MYGHEDQCEVHFVRTPDKTSSFSDLLYLQPYRDKEKMRYSGTHYPPHCFIALPARDLEDSREGHLPTIYPESFAQFQRHYVRDS